MTHASNENFIVVLNSLASPACSIRAAATSIGADSSTIFRWLKDTRLVVHDWPEPGDAMDFKSAFTLSRKMSCVQLESVIREECAIGQVTVLTGPGGIVYLEDEDVVASGLIDPNEIDLCFGPGQRDRWLRRVNPATGKRERVPATVRTAAPAALRVATIRAMLPSTWGEHRDVTVSVGPSVLVVGSKPILSAVAVPVTPAEPGGLGVGVPELIEDRSQPGDFTEIEPDHVDASPDAPAPEPVEHEAVAQPDGPEPDITEDRESDSELVRDLRRRLRQGVTNPTPVVPIAVGGRESDPPDDAPPHAARPPSPRPGIHDPNPNEGYKVA